MRVVQGCFLKIIIIIYCCYLNVLWMLKDKKYSMGAGACARFRKEREKKWRPASGENPGFGFEIYGRKVEEVSGHVCTWKGRLVY